MVLLCFVGSVKMRGGIEVEVEVMKGLECETELEGRRGLGFQEMKRGVGRL